MEMLNLLQMPYVSYWNFSQTSNHSELRMLAVESMEKHIQTALRLWTVM